MIKYLFALLMTLLCSTLNAQENNNTQNYEALQEAFYHDMGNIELNWHIAQEAIRLKKYDDAFAALDRLRILSDDAFYTLVLAELYDTLGMENQARVSLLDIKNLAPKYQERFKRLQAKYTHQNKNKLTLIANALLGVDTNINNSAPQAVLQDYFQSTNVTDTLSDAYIQLGVYLDDDYTIGTHGNYFLKNRLLVSSTNYLSQTNYNLLVSRFSTAVGYKSHNFSLLFPLQWDYINFSSKSLLNKFALTPKLFYPLSAKLLSSVIVKVGTKQYIDPLDLAKNSIFSALALELKQKHAKQYTTNLSYELFHSFKQDSQALQAFIDYYTHILRFFYEKKISPYTLFGRYEIRASFYADKVNGQARMDSLHDVTLGAKKALDTKTYFLCEASFSQNHSNIAIYSYDKFKTSCSFSYSY